MVVMEPVVEEGAGVITVVMEMMVLVALVAMVGQE